MFEKYDKADQLTANFGQFGIGVPVASDWVDYGPVLETGSEGTWDFLWAGATPASVIKKDGIYYFYYIAADGYRSHDGGPRHRAIGVATSPDGIHFTKYEGNPIMTHRPLNGEEEGANSAGVTLDGNSNFVMYYGAAKGSREIIRADGRVAASRDGFDFYDIGIVLNHRNPLLYGFGDEIFPLATFYRENEWFVYYVPNGVPASGTLGMARGQRFDKLYRTTRVLGGNDGEKPFGIWGNVVWLSSDVLALFIQRSLWPDSFIEVRLASLDAPHRLSDPIYRYDIPNLKRGTVYLDVERRTWFMYYNDFDRYWDVKLAPVGEPDTTPPSRPGKLAGRSSKHDVIELSWEPAHDSDTGIVIYNVYRNGEMIGRTKGLVFKDTGLKELVSYSYNVAAVNFHGVEGPKTTTTVTTQADTIAPRLVSVTTGGNYDQALVTFDEPVGRDSAVDNSKYIISDNVQVTEATLINPHTVRLSTLPHLENRFYKMIVNGIFDRAINPNMINSDSQLVYTHSPITGLVGYWNLDQGTGSIAYDVSGFESMGKIHGASWSDGIINGALYFDGLNDYVVIDNYPALNEVTESSFAFSTWVKPDGVPVKNKPYGILQRISGYPPYYFGLSYDADQKYLAKIVHSPSESSTVITSSQIEIGGWHYLTMVVDDINKLMYLYVDAEQVIGSPVIYEESLYDLDSDSGASELAGEYYIGSNRPDRGAGSYYTQHFRGMIDDVRVYDRALTSLEVRQLYEEVLVQRNHGKD